MKSIEVIYPEGITSRRQWICLNSFMNPLTYLLIIRDVLEGVSGHFNISTSYATLHFVMCI